MMVRFSRLQEEHLAMVMGWRTKPEISQYMITDVDYNLDKQRQWFDEITNNDTCCHWVIYCQDAPIGLINLAAIDRINLRCSAGYYIGEEEYRYLGAMIPPYLYNYVFGEMKFRKIYGEVMAGNEKVLQMHKLHGFRQVGIYRDHIFKNGCFYDAVLMELLSESWAEQKRYRRYIAELP